MSLIDQKDFFLLEEIVKKNFAAKYKGSVIGIFWSVLKPLLTMIVLTIIFSTAFGRRIENFPVYYLSGKILFDFFTSGASTSMFSIKNNENIIKKTAAPRYIYVLGGIISELLNFFITLIILVLVMIATGAPFHFNTIPLAIIPFFSLLLMVTGVSFFLSIINVYYNDVAHLWGVVTVILMYASAIFYPMDIIPFKYRRFMMLNPMYWIIDQFRNFAIFGNIPNLLSIVNSLLISTIILVFGIIIFKKYQKKVAMKF